MKLPWESVIEQTVGNVVKEGMNLLDEAFHTDAEKAEESRELFGAKLNAIVASNLAQIKANEMEARTGSRGWRHKLGVVLTYALAYALIVQPLMAWCIQVYVALTPYAIPAEHIALLVPPEIDLGEIIAMLGGMLGLGGWRSFDLKEGSRI